MKYAQCVLTVLTPFQSQEDLKTFTWYRSLSELSIHAPILYGIIRAATKVKRERSNPDAVIGVCAAIFLKHRFGKMSLFKFYHLKWTSF